MANKKNALLQYFTFVFLLIATNSFAQNKYWVSYKNKDATIYSINQAEKFLSQKALARRAKYNIAIDETDLPVCQSYEKAVKNTDVVFRYSSKWLNGSLIETSNTNAIAQIKQMPFVKEVKLLQSATQNKSNLVEKRKLEIQKIQTSDYGRAKNQIEMLNGQYLHNLGFLGEGIDIAVMDNGFPYVDSNRFFSQANAENRIKEGYDFVNNHSVFSHNNGSHGALVISTMVANIADTLVGTSPKANYFLFSTEDKNNEGLPEEYNWAKAAEMADTLLGNNAILSTSLGYSNGFDVASTNHQYADMEGNSTPITIAADLAAKKGMLVINSAGNEGNNPWRYITAPSDGDSVLCVGAVNAKGVITNFSSRGPSADGRIKPNVCAQGENVAAVSQNENLVWISGTSFSCPITAGMAACLWQAFPNKSNMDIFYAIEKSANLYKAPNDEYGYGIPNFELAYDLLSPKFREDFYLYALASENKLEYFIPKNLKDKKIKVEIFDNIGNKVFSQINLADTKTKTIDLSTFAQGIYFFHLAKGKQIYKTKFVKK